MNESVILRRVFAWIVDAPVYAFPTMALATLLADFEIAYIVVAITPIVFVFRDVISPKGRSIGKRMFELNILNKSSNEPASAKQKIVRNLFFLIYFIDGIVMIVTKESIGDKVANTVVVKN